VADPSTSCCLATYACGQEHRVVKTGMLVCFTCMYIYSCRQLNSFWPSLELIIGQIQKRSRPTRVIHFTAWVRP
jgi:hypothetical protein